MEITELSTTAAPGLAEKAEALADIACAVHDLAVEPLTRANWSGNPGMTAPSQRKMKTAARPSAQETGAEWHLNWTDGPLREQMKQHLADALAGHRFPDC